MKKESKALISGWVSIPMKKQVKEYCEGQYYSETTFLKILITQFFDKKKK